MALDKYMTGSLWQGVAWEQARDWLLLAAHGIIHLQHDEA
jgi:hypothetical protein